MGNTEGLYLEVAVGEKFNRNHIIRADELTDLVRDNPDKEVYRSYFHFDEDRLEHAKKKRATREFAGMLYVRDLHLDYDGPGALDATRRMYQKLVGLGVDPMAIRVWFSGMKGFHIWFPDVFGFKDSRFVAQDVRSTLSEFAPGADLSMIHKSGLIRADRSLHAMSGMYKTMLSHERLMSSDLNTIKALCLVRQVAPEPYTLEHPYVLDTELIEHDGKEIASTKAITGQRPTVYMGCMQRLYARGPVKGRRNQDLLRLITSWRPRGLGSEECINLGWQWLKSGDVDGVSHYDVVERVQWVFETAAHHYSCDKDPVMLEFCIGSQCPLYKYRHTQQEAVTMAEAMDQYKSYVLNPPRGGFNLNEIYDGVNFSIRPGDVTILLADTKIGKSTLFLNWAVKMKRLRWLNITTEMQITEMLERSLQIEYGLKVVDGEGVNEVRDLALYGNGQWSSMLSEVDHMKLICSPPFLEDMSRIIVQEEPDVVIIDPLEMIEVKGSRELTNDLANGIRKLASSHNIPILVIHHINKEGQKEGMGGQKIEPWMAKGYKRVLEQADHVLAFEGSHDQPYRTLRRMMGRRPQELDIRLEGDVTTFRFKRAEI